MQDPLLKALVALANEADLEIGITLSLPGGAISGQIISSKRYFEEIGDGLANAWPNGGNQSLGNLIKELGGIGQEDLSVVSTFVHLKNARYVSASGFLPNHGEGVFWRGKVESVIGFNLGAYTPNV